jgi:hypothetical protein
MGHTFYTYNAETYRSTVALPVRFVTGSKSYPYKIALHYLHKIGLVIHFSYGPIRLLPLNCARFDSVSVLLLVLDNIRGEGGLDASLLLRVVYVFCIEHRYGSGVLFKQRFLIFLFVLDMLDLYLINYMLS